MAVSYWDGKQWIDLASGQQGPPGPAGNGISSVVMNADYTLTINFTNGSSYTTPSIRGEQGEEGEQGPAGADGEDGVGIASVALISGTHAPGTLDTYRITLTDGSTYDFQVYNGADGQGSPGSQTPTHLGTGSAGSAAAYAREDHVHPGFVELWTNSAPSSNFAAQTVPIDLSGWHLICIMCKQSATGTYVTPCLAAVGETTTIAVPNASSTQYFYKRDVTVTTSGVTFTTGYRNTTGTTGANYCVPTGIYGVC